MMWKDDGWQYILYDDDGRALCEIHRWGKDLDVWSLSVIQFDDDWSVHFQAKTAEEAMWQATLIIYDECNRKANYYHRIRDHLPSIHELADRAGI